jgi:uncharacterized protein YggU (UPF0235/DUF167 family)
VIDLEAHRDGVVFRVRAQAGARSSALRGEQDGALKVAVTQVAEKGKANKAILRLLCKQLGLRRSQLELLSWRDFLRQEVSGSRGNTRRIEAGPRPGSALN